MTRRSCVCSRLAVIGVWLAPMCFAQTARPTNLASVSTAGPPAEVIATIGPHALPTSAVADVERADTNALDKATNDAMLMLARGQIKEAVPVFKQVLREDGTHRKAMFGLGTSYVELRRYREAEVVLTRMLELYPDAFEAMNNLAWMYATATEPAYRDGARAIRYAQQALLLAPKSMEIWNTLSEAYYISGEYEKAQRAAAEAVRLATERQATGRVVREYQHQLDKCKQAADAMSLVE